MAMGLMNSGRGGRRSRRAPMAEINVTPFVDVMLVLLIIFMVTAPLLASGVPIELPDSNANPVDQTPDQVTISIDGEGYVFIDDARVPVGGLPQALETIDRGADGKGPIIVLRGDKALDYGRVMAVMGELNRAGFNSISLITNAKGAATPVSSGSSDEE
ncbi:Biopolymer transport protein ExbD /TolR [Altererythrobacter epoxidivorans]|uniref:Biopolymer transport protein ExbD /TolR n=1 Tax=Altererythrobacter epoxidivorans TaxID=361183 RepID=A0A0M4M653_9SPHN|nr:biopolymer transporter ExbD [Altererythrobacter epoxidivorans]ALE15751.1 Biopolymer transport protein ExbD /TolR [Altererythrobacter epoxidivorans]